MAPEIQDRVRASSVYSSIVQAIKGGQEEKSNQLMGHLQELKDEMAKNTELTTKVLELTNTNSELMTKIYELSSKTLEMTTTNSELMTKNCGLSMENNGLGIQMINLQEAFEAKQEEMRQQQIQALKQLSLLQNRVQAVMTQTYELHEYPIPHSSWNIRNPFSNKFRLYFLCECGEHTKSNNSKIPHHIHLAKHEGYDIARPTEFFKQYGSYVLTILKMLKFGISVAGIALPALSQLVNIDALDQACTSLKQLSKNIQPGINQVIGCIEASEDEVETVNGIKDQMEDNEALEGADLRKLVTFLKSKDGNKVLGNLYRTVTTEGHVKW
ncbi:hypothetical protein BGZ65_011168, partial [Modicella reniformis]